MASLKEKRCVPCEGGTLPLSEAEAAILLEHIPQWILQNNGGTIFREFVFRDFARALAFVNKIGEIAEEEGHHPDLSISWGKVGVSLTTHAIHGLSGNDFILAAKIDSLQ